MGKKKMIENYELLDMIAEVDNMYEIYKAKHVEERKNYTIKKVKTKNDKNNKLYEGFLNEATLLKSIKHPNIARSIKMMKTSSSIYVVYDYYGGPNLEEWMETGSKRTLQEKQNIIKQLCILVAELRKAGIAHLFLNPECIYVSEGGDVKVTDFLYGLDMPDTEEQVELHNKVPKNDYTAPQVKKGIACYESDIYSFGKIVQFMDLSKSKKGTLSLKQFNTKCEELQDLIKRTIKKKSSERDNIEEVYKVLFKAKGKLKKMKSLSMSLSKVGGGKDSMLSRTSVISTATNKQKTEFTQDLILKIIKRRNISRLLVELFRNVVESNYHNATDLLIFVTLLLKKSTLILSGIGKFMRYGKGIQGLELNEKDRNRFFKSMDYAKMQPLIEAEVKVQKKQFEVALEWIYLDNVKILQNKKFNMQLKKEEIDETYFREVTMNFVRTAVQQIDFDSEHTNLLRTIYLLSIILDHGGIEIFFEKKINLTPVDLAEQAIFIKLYKQMSINDMMSELQKYRNIEPSVGNEILQSKLA